jgi:hypothetical protein
MKLVACLAAGALFVTGCGSDDSASPAKAPTSQQAAASGTSSTSAGVSAAGTPSAATLCAAEGKGKPKRQCTSGLKRLARGKAKNPAVACKSLSRKRTKGVRGKSPYAVCVKAAAKLMASTNSTGSTGGADNSPADTSTDETDETDTSASASDNGNAQPLCVDADGNDVPIDSPDVEECTDPADDSAPDPADAEDDPDSSDDGG